eukprot:TRINITY_DN10704_c0_g2_i1.p1 TRINITY_DN10704_c0_g2~~TRINITY_DN10704_c0_g2_i1.p1  ORF type:complete len:233 (-),score=45.71 TRINITY_DN10704_c0_g2_i1:113-811(-)
MYTIAMPPLFPYKVTPPDVLYLKQMLIGLLEAFPTYSQDFFMYYLYTKEGVQTHYTIAQLAKIVLKKGERPEVKDTYRCNWACNESSDSDKENISAHANKIHSKKSVTEKTAVPLKCANPSDPYQVMMEGKWEEAVPRKSSELQSIEQIKSNLLEQIEEEGINGHPIFYTEERSDSLNDEDYEYTQLNTSTLKELSDLGRDSLVDGKTTERVSSAVDSDLFCTESINECFKV